MATTITAGNATNGAIISPDNTGILELKTGTGAGTTGLTINASQAATFAGAITSSGLVTGATGALYPIVSGTAVTASGTSVDFTSIPSWVKRITLMLNGVSTNGTSDAIVQLGDSGGVENTGYVANASLITSSTVAFSSTAGFPLSGSWSASVFFSGLVTLVLQDAATNTWTASVTGAMGSPVGAGVGGGYKALSATLDRVRITTVGGANTFDTGTINILWE